MNHLPIEIEKIIYKYKEEFEQVDKFEETYRDILYKLKMEEIKRILAAICMCITAPVWGPIALLIILGNFNF